jgi:hypothetical protein
LGRAGSDIYQEDLLEKVYLPKAVQEDIDSLPAGFGGRNKVTVTAGWTLVPKLS